ncbi:MAG: hypothetical protein LUE93_14925 [Bacteroides sp.]|nr:hypothetical protein [Bacteroides sp.]
MKKINILTKKILYGYLFISFVLSSCVKNDLLDREDPAGLDDAKAWTTDYLTKLGMNGVYAALRLGGQTGTSTPFGMELYQFDKFVTSQDRNTHAFLTGTANSSIAPASYK